MLRKKVSEDYNSEKKLPVKWVWSNWPLLLPLFGCTITLIPGFFVLKNLWKGLPQIDLKIQLDKSSFYLANMDAQTYFILAQLILAVSSIVAIFLTGYVVFHTLAKLPRRILVISLVLLFLFVVIGISPNDMEFYESLFEPFFDQIKQMEKIYEYADPRFIDRLQSYADAIIVLVLVGISLVMLGFVVSVYTKSVKNTILLNELASQRRKLLLVLYSGAILLICGVITTYAYVRIPGVFLAQSEYAATFNKISSLITIAFGIVLSLCLAGGFLPASVILSERARTLSMELGRGDPGFDSRAWLQQHDLTTSMAQKIVRIVAILSPFLVSLTQFFNFFPK